MGDGNNKVAAAKDQSPINTLSTTMRRLPLGHSAKDSSNTAATLFHLLVPTNTGGELSFLCASNLEMTLFAHDGTTKLAGPSTLGTLFRQLAPSAGTAETHGRYYLLVKGPSPREVSCKLRQTGIAREGTTDTAPPLIPWNFYFWPTARTFTDGTTNPAIAKMEAIVRNYAKVFKHDGDKGVKFEEKCHQVAVGDRWYGHCHMVSRATILFERPAATTLAVPGNPSDKVTFTEEELWFLAGEWFAAWAERKDEYVYADASPPFTDQKAMGEDGQIVTVKGAFPKKYWGDFLKPAELDLPKAEFIERVKAAIVAHDVSLEPRAERLAQAAARADRATIKMLFGQRAAFFYAALSDNICVKHDALVGDLRGGGGGNTPEEVWNHAAFYYEASFKEILPRDEQGREDPESLAHQGFMELILTLVANEDYGALPSESEEQIKPPGVPDSGGSSVTVSGGTVENRKCRHVLHIVFDVGTGKVDIPTQAESEENSFKDTRHRWVSCKGDNNDDIYIPRYLAKVLPAANKTPPAKRTTGTDLRELGNPIVELDIAAPPSSILKIRKRYLK